MAQVEEIKEEVVASLESDLDAWESFYKKFRQDYARITEYEKKIQRLEDEIKRRDSLVKQKLEKEKGMLLVLTFGYIASSIFLLLLIASSLNVWLYFTAGMLVGLGGFALLYLWSR